VQQPAFNAFPECTLLKSDKGIIFETGEFDISTLSFEQIIEQADGRKKRPVPCTVTGLAPSCWQRAIQPSP
jgi:hypothetical protein